MKLNFAISILWICLAAPGHAEEWRPYTNDATGFSLSLPDSFTVDDESAGRLSLNEISGAAQLDVFGVTNPERLTVAQFQDMVEAADPNRRITYRAAGKRWFVLSGYLADEKEPTIFYAKFMLNGSGTALSVFEISYRKADKAKYDSVVEHLEHSLTSPR